jgi:pimeloyl-ACP methyl ester carboxylesterase
VDLFVRESGPVGAPAIVFLHGGYMSGWSWEPVVERMRQRYRCLVPDLPQYGESAEQGPFEMGRAAEAVGELIRSHTSSGRAHVVGFSLGAQVGVQLLAAQPELVDAAVLCGTPINAMPGRRFNQFLLGQLTRMRWFRWVTKLHWDIRHARLPFPKTVDYHNDARLMTGVLLANIVMASAGFAIPEGLEKSDSAVLFITGADELSVTRRWAASLAQTMHHGVDGVAIGMRHDWPLRNPELFSRTVDGWLCGTTLPSQIGLVTSGSPIR